MVWAVTMVKSGGGTGLVYQLGAELVAADGNNKQFF